ncbi:MAG: peptidylprolyl isomerase [Pirellulales bacterium]|nr:peptidylprolyl isomerase [Pirellulales bacterium]
MEHLEPRRVMSVSPTLAALSDVTLAAGAPLHIALDAADGDGDNLNFYISISNENISGGSLSYLIPQGNRSMLISTNYGDMVFELFEQRAPRTTARIIELAEADFYDGLIFHRVAEYSTGEPFVIQGGDPDGDGTGGSGFDFDDEFNDTLLHTSAGVLSMAKSNDDTNDSQFFITGTSTRHLDFNHSIFGFQVEGGDVRQTIEQVAVDENDKPLTDVVMESVQIFYDNENGVLMLSAPEGASGTADVTVTVDDGNGGTTSQTFQVTIVADTDTSANSPPYLGEIDDVETTADTPVSFYIPATDLEGDSIYYAGLVSSDTDDLTIDVDSVTGLVTVTPSGGITGVYDIVVGVQKSTGGNWDTQMVPVLINPAAPTSIDLLANSDTGESAYDNITALNNTSGQPLSFLVGGTVPGAMVSLYADGQLIGQGLANGTATLVTTNSSLTLSHGDHLFTARQTLFDVDLEVGNRDEQVDLQSELSSPLTVTVDTVAAQFTNTAPTQATAGILYEYQATVNESGVTFSLQNAPAGMTVSSSGLVSWTPGAQQAAQHSFTLIATDLAGHQTPQAITIDLLQGPDVQPVGNQAVDEGQTVSFTVSATPHGDDGPLVFSLVDGTPAAATIDPDSGEFSWITTEADGPGQYTINIRVTAPSGANHVESVLVSVGEINQPPVLDPIDDLSAAEGQLIDFAVSAGDLDLPANQLSYSLLGNVPSGAAIDGDGRFTWRPGESHGGGSYAFTVQVSDSKGATDEQTFTVTVAEVDQAPRFDPVDNQLVMAGNTLLVRVEAVDPDLPANSLHYQIESGAPDGLTIDPDTGLISWTVPTEYTAGPFDLVVRATEVGADQQPGLSTTATLRITVFSPASAWLMMGQALSAPSLGESFVAREAIDALLSGSPNPSGAALRFVPVSVAAAIGSDNGLLGFELSYSGGSGGRPVASDEEIDENASGENPEADKPKADDLDTQVLSIPKISSEKLDEAELVELENDAETPSDAEMAQAVDAAIDDLDTEETTDDSEA